MKKLLCEMLIIVTFVSGVCFWVLNEWRQRHPEPVKQVKIKIYKGKWHSNYLEVMK